MFTRVLRTLARQISTALCAVAFLTPVYAHANTYTTENFLFSYHYKPATFSLATNGGFTGTLENGTNFTQTPIITDPSVRLHKFTIDDAYFYISDKGTFQASSNIVALSIYSYLATT